MRTTYALGAWEPAARLNLSAFSTCGRVCCDRGETKLNDSSTMLQIPLEVDEGLRMRISLDEITGISIFPGQTITATVTNPAGNELVVKEMYDGAPLAFEATPVKALRDFNYGPSFAAGKPVVAMFAAGPFTGKEDLAYQPLADLCSAALQQRPDVLILVSSTQLGP